MVDPTKKHAKKHGEQGTSNKLQKGGMEFLVRLKTCGANGNLVPGGQGR